MNYYNENDPRAAAWLRELIKNGHIATGEVDERSIADVRGCDLAGFCQCHFFAGIGGWSYAMRLSGWPDDEPVWTGSCPCQPLSCAGKRKGHADERHLWPTFYALISECKPATIFGEQVAGPDGREWLAGVRADLEGSGYAVGASDLCAAGVGAPHPRQRLYWVANSTSSRCEREKQVTERKARNKTRFQLPGEHIKACGVVLANGSGRHSRKSASATTGHRSPVEPTSGAGGLGDSDGTRLKIGIRESDNDATAIRQDRRQASKQTNPWSIFDICYFTGTDAGKSRRVEAGTFPLAHRIPGRVGLLRGYGNAIVPQVAAQFILSAVESIDTAPTSA